MIFLFQDMSVKTWLQGGWTWIWSKVETGTPNPPRKCSSTARLCISSWINTPPEMKLIIWMSTALSRGELHVWCVCWYIFLMCVFFPFELCLKSFHSGNMFVLGLTYCYFACFLEDFSGMNYIPSPTPLTLSRQSPETPWQWVLIRFCSGFLFFCCF